MPFQEAKSHQESPTRRDQSYYHWYCRKTKHTNLECFDLYDEMESLICDIQLGECKPFCNQGAHKQARPWEAIREIWWKTTLARPIIYGARTCVIASTQFSSKRTRPSWSRLASKMLHVYIFHIMITWWSRPWSGTISPIIVSSTKVAR